ncbi:ABC transporter permease [Rubinisphaera sp. JC750]|uniref:ABC transporter permease n=1 Tax=Rubinisphaera sp. JC750 TaxID=2898658 RepID=UPI001F2FD5ED|nr:ABC transporter permease [Rubinisphaera sp. JC750]
MQRIQSLVRQSLPPLVSLLVVLVVWDLAVRWLEIDRFLLPTPDQVAKVLLGRSQELFSATVHTLFNAGMGFLLSLACGTVVAVMFAEFRWLRISCYPYAIFLHTVPIVAISPLIITWFGYGSQSVIVITFIVSLFPVITGATNGLLSASTELKELFTLYRASRWQTLLKLKFPAAVPQLVTGAQTASGMAVVGAIVGEFFAGYDSGAYGLGYYIFAAQGQFRTDVLLAAVLLSTLLGIALFAVVAFTANTLLRRWTIV